MCFPDDAVPPAFRRRGPVSSASLVLPIEGGAGFDAVSALPRNGGALGVLVLPDGRGLHPFYRRMAIGLAGAGFPALAIDLYGRTAGIGPRPADFPSGEHSRRLRWEQVRADLLTGVRTLRDGGAAAVAVVGFCLGGRIALLSATCPELDPAGAVAFYPQVHGAARSDLPAPDELVESLAAPTMSVFGGSDELIPTSDVRGWERLLRQAGRPDPVYVYPGAPHSFFDRRAAEFTTATEDAATRLIDFLDRPSPPPR